MPFLSHINFEAILYRIPVLLLTLPLHECAHGYVANRLGDPTAKYSDRLTMNPIKHFDPIGFLCMIFVGFGWAKPVPVNPNNFRKPRRDMALTAAAGPASNLIFGFITTLLLVIAGKLLGGLVFYEKNFAYNFCNGLLTLLYLFSVTNIGLAIFNLIPCVPLDGSRILYYFLPPKTVFKIRPYERYIQIALLALLLFGFLSGPLSFVSGKIYEGFYFVCDKVTFFI